MHAYARWKFWLILTVLIGSIMGAAPNVMTSLPSWWPASMSQPMNLGLDLKGGIHLVVDVDIEQVVKQQVSDNINVIRRALREENIRYSKLESNATQVTVVIKEVADINQAEKVLKAALNGFTMEAVEADTLVFTISENEVKDVKSYAIEQTIEVIRRRVDALGTTEPVIMRQGDRRVLVQIPGYQDSARAKAIIGQTAQLEFKLVDEKGDLDQALQGQIPADDMIAYGSSGQPYLLKKRTELSGKDVAKARVSIDPQYNEPAVSLTFNNQGARQFDRLTNENVNKRFAILLEGVVQSAPVIRERISGGTAQISGSFTPTEAHDLAIVLRAGALPAPIKVVEERSIGPSLGQDSIDQGLSSIIYGCVAVLLFMVVYYRFFGLVANIALLFNIVLIAAAMSMLGATLTLPGIAGIVLTIGMAVDANVLIFERIREEINNGKTPFSAIDGGYDKAFSTIMDANITTLIAAIVLFQFGTGPIKGFAVTLSVGILASMFTAIVVTRAIIVLSHKNRKNIKELSI
ncbi:MAG: protein-export membrane protein SecD [Zetaproteobacteria bacterium CG2_30_46_52]|nr:MAG: protein-export membrane protein SecD [Zetaproteobacteria bacterium CG2_30_46_52]